MTELTTPSGPATGQGGQSATEQVREKTQEVAETVREQASSLRGRLSEQVDTRSTQVGEQTGSVAEAMRRSSQQLRDEGKDGPASVVEGIAERVESLGEYLRGASADRIFDDVESVARRRPWLVGAGGLVAGLLASRLLKASSERRRSERWDAPHVRSYTEPYSRELGDAPAGAVRRDW